MFLNGQTVDSDSLAPLSDRGVKIVKDRVLGLDLQDGWMKQVKTQGGSVVLDGLFLITKTHQASDLATQLGCAFEDGPFGPYVRVDNLQETSVSGVFAAGDMARPIHQSVWAAADGSAAGAFCHQSLLNHRNPYQKNVA